MINPIKSTSRFRLSALVAAAAAAVLALPGCMAEATHGGSDTETLSGVLLTYEGKPAAGARVKLIPSTYDPSHPDTARIRVAVTDQRGRYAFPMATAAGSFNLLASLEKVGAVYRGSLSADSVPDTLRLGPARVLIVSMYKEGFVGYEPGQVWFPGTDIFVRCEVDSPMVVNSLPRNLNALVLEGKSGWRHSYTITDPGDTLAIGASRHGVLSNLTY